MAYITFDEDKQKTMLELVYKDSSVFTQVKPLLKPEYFCKKLQPLVSYLIRFTDEYSTLPVYEQLVDEVRIPFRNLNVTYNANNRASILEMTETFAKQRSLELAIEEAYQMITKGELSGIDKVIKDAQNISLNKDLGINFWEKPKEWLDKQESEQGILPTGWKTFDNIMFGGFGWGELEYVVAPANSGKSLCMQNLALNWSCMGYNVLFLTLEMNKELVGKRIAAMEANVPYKSIRGNIDQVSNAIIYKRKDIQPGILQLIDLPIGCNANQIEALIQQFEISTHVIPQIIVIDYADIMTPCDTRIDPNNINRCDKAITLELRDIARERTKNGKNTTILTASQITKDAMDEMEFGMSKIAGGTTKSQNADNIFSIRTNDALRQKGEYEIKFLKTRNSSGKDRKLKMKFNVDTLLISDLEEVQSTIPLANGTQSMSGALATLQGLVQTSNK